MSDSSNDTPAPERLREKQRRNVRVCDICHEEVPQGIDGMYQHLLQSHTQEELVREVSREWSPDVPRSFHHPNGTIHFLARWGPVPLVITTKCGREFRVEDLDVEGDDEEILKTVLSYEYGEVEQYCETCVEEVLNTPTLGKNDLPLPLRDADESEIRPSAKTRSQMRDVQ